MSGVDSCLRDVDSCLSGVDSCLRVVDSCLSGVVSCLSGGDSCLSGVDSCLSGVDRGMRDVDSCLSGVDRGMRGEDRERYTGGGSCRISDGCRRYIVNHLIVKGMKMNEVNRKLKCNNLKRNDNVNND
jgi:hypothetical protein